MSLNLYFDKEKVRKHPTFQAGGPLGHGLDHVLGVGLHDNPGGYLVFADINIRPTTDFIGLLSHVTLKEDFSTHPFRIRGRYRLETAEGALDFGAKQRSYDFLATGPTIEVVRELYLQVRAGTIAPVESWEVEQVPPLVVSRVRRFFRRLWREITASS
jgi:hypothetical protein